MYIVITLLVVGFAARSFESCPEDFCPALWTKTTTPSQESESVFLGEDKESGCRCREYPGRYSFCFGRATCHAFPKNITFNTDTFLLKATQIFEIKPGDMKLVTGVTTLQIEANFNLSRIASGTFLEMVALRNLSISYNTNLRFLEKGCFDGLVNLEKLKLVKNGFVELSEVTPSLIKLSKLTKLELSENIVKKITEQDFQFLKDSPLEELHLILCQIEDIEPKAFNSLKNLTSLRLGENNFNTTTLARVIEETAGNVPLKLLNLYATGLRKSSLKDLLLAIAKTNITSLSLARNQFEVISGETFPRMPNLEILDLKESLVLNITDNAFVGLPNLRTLLLSGNKLASIPEGALLEQLTYLDLQLNSGDAFSATYFSLYGEKFVNMKKLKRLNLSFNTIHALYNTSFKGLENLEILALKNATIYVIANGSFADLRNLLFLNLEHNLFMKNHPLALNEDMFKGLQNLRVLLLGGCGITFIDRKASPFKNLQKLRHLGLEHNKLIILPSFEVLVNLRTIDVSGNSLQPWQISIFYKNSNLKDVRMSGNKFAYLTNAMVEDFKNLTHLEIKDNPYTCDCSLKWNDERIMKLIDNETILCAFPDTTTTLTVKEFLQNNYHCQNWTLVVPLVFLIIFGGVTIFSLYYFRWHLRYWLFLTRLHLSRNRKIRRNTEVKGYVNYMYDAFVSYSNEDRNFVIRLVTMLENYPPYIKLCVYERDFEVGTLISENVLENVAKSRKTLLIISNSYAKSQWCRWESQIAEHHRLFLQNENGEYVDDSLILIKLGPVNETHMTPTLKYLLKTRIYLQWDVDDKKQKIFWEKLREALAPPKEVNENTYL
ncbi:hypothetical protein Zmor_023415 [Zophobas morio]|uniref:TIR domain-containing protein n=1 Tax=Zophobas morio TaxID=2755281 RepID=A0AA38HYA8_9CUCU|nr:hypothetical protein Zmor_023415 [Zophobas morio]